MKNSKAIILLILFPLFCSCQIDLNLKREDKAWLKPYEKNDTLIFKSDNNLRKLIITNVEVENVESDIMESSYNSVHGTVNYRRDNDTIEKNIITISKIYPKQPTGAFFEFENNVGRIIDINNYPVSTIIFRGKEREGYMFRPYKPEKPSFWWDEEYGLEKPNLEYFFWDKEYGIVEYKTMQGEILVLDKFIRNGKNVLEK